MKQTGFEFTPPPSLPQRRLDLPFTLTDGQNQAVDAFERMMQKLEPAIMVTAGFAGVGKTTLLRVFAQLYGTPVVITPTGKAALRVREATGLAAQTIHRWIYKSVTDEHTGVMRFVRRYPDEIEVTPSRLVLLDEASMVSPDLWRDISATCKSLNLKLVCVGDPFQLPPVDPGSTKPFSILTPDFAASIGAERVEMTEILRQAQDSPIIRASMALRAGHGLRSFAELQMIALHDVGRVATEVYRAGGVTICHRNVTRFQLNAGIRAMLGIRDEMPQLGEPLLVLKNTPEIGVVNGEAVQFPGWRVEPLSFEPVKDRFKHVEEAARFGATTVGGLVCTLALEELHGRLQSGMRPIAISGSQWARMENLFLGDNVAPHLHANFGYAYTAHKSQGSEWPYALVILESSIRLNDEEGRRWAYTAITRASKAVALFVGKLS